MISNDMNIQYGCMIVITIIRDKWLDALLGKHGLNILVKNNMMMYNAVKIVTQPTIPIYSH